VKESQKAGSDFVESREDPAVVLEESKGALDFMAFFVEMPIVVTLNETITFGGDNGFGSRAFHIGDDGIGVVPLVG